MECEVVKVKLVKIIYFLCELEDEFGLLEGFLEGFLLIINF